MKYVHYYETVSAFTEDYEGEAYLEPWVSYTNENDHVDYNKAPVPPDPRLEYFTFEIQSPGTILWKGSSKTIEYSKNGGEWTSITNSSTGTPISVAANDTLEFRGDSQYGYGGCSFGSSNATFSIKGNIASLIDSTNFTELTSLTGGGHFNAFFSGCLGLVDARYLFIPNPAASSYGSLFVNCTNLVHAPLELPSELAANCFMTMFSGCISLVTAPELPATSLTSNCYQSMFEGCTSLTTAPELPATSLTLNCYNTMFKGCTSLTTAPELPAPTLVDWCYQNMFSGCTNLNYIKCLATSGITHNNLNTWIKGVSSTGTFVRPSASVSAWNALDQVGERIPDNWVQIDA